MRKRVKGALTIALMTILLPLLVLHPTTTTPWFVIITSFCLKIDKNINIKPRRLIRAEVEKQFQFVDN